MTKPYRIEGQVLLTNDNELLRHAAEAGAQIQAIPGSRLMRFHTDGRTSCRCCGEFDSTHDLGGGILVRRIEHGDGCEAQPLLVEITDLLQRMPDVSDAERDDLARRYAAMAAKYAGTISELAS